MIETRPETANPEGTTEGSTRHAIPSRLLHELRTPLNHIIGYSELLLEQAQEKGHEALAPDLKNVRAAGGHLLALINDNFKSIMSPDFGAATNGDYKAAESFTEEPTSGRTESATAQGTLLVVDDDAANRDVLARRLMRQGYDVSTAENGRLALEMIRESAFDLVLLDIMMPEMDGFEVLKRLKSDDSLHQIPVIMISAMSETDSAVRCIELGAEDYLPKPFDPVLLKARTVACLERKRAHDREVDFTTKLQESYRRAQELERMRDDLTNMIVHDLRTPMTSVLSGLKTLVGMGDLDEIQLEMLEISLTGGETLLGMINDLLDISKMESGLLELDLKEVSPADLVSSALCQVESLANSKDLKLLTEMESGLPSFVADRDKLLRTLVNLLGNAVKFTPSGGAITVSARRSDVSMQFSVGDTGEGIPAEAFARIFEKFGQVESRTAGRKHSTGLGLTFCKLAVEAHGGRIWLESNMGKGSTFSFIIPLS